MHIDEGSCAKFACRIGGDPAPKVRWEKDGEKLHDGGRWQVCTHVTQATSFVMLSRLTFL